MLFIEESVESTRFRLPKLNSAPINRPVLSATVLEATDELSWITPGMFLLTSSTTLAKSEMTPTDLMRALSAKCISGVGIRFRDVDATSRRQFIELSDQYSIPLFQIPETVTYLEVLSHINKLAAEVRDLEERKERACRQLLPPSEISSLIPLKSLEIHGITTDSHAFIPMLVKSRASQPQMKADVPTSHRPLWSSVLWQVELTRRQSKVADYLTCRNGSALFIVTVVPVDDELDHLTNVRQLAEAIATLDTVAFVIHGEFCDAATLTPELGRLAQTEELIQRLRISQGDQNCFSTASFRWLWDCVERLPARSIKEDCSFVDKLLPSPLLDTLIEYFNSDENLQATSEKLFIHVNTLKYRLDRISQVTGLNPKRSYDKLELLYLITIYQLYRSNFDLNKKAGKL